MSLRRWRWYWLAPSLLGIGLYALTIRGVFVYDDLSVCGSDERLHDPGKWILFFKQAYMPDAADNLWRPLVSLTYAVQAWGNGDHPWAFHLVNILLHGIACGMVAALGARLCGRRVGLVAGLLFAAHPVHVEAVAGIVGRAEEMALIGILAGLLVFIGKPLNRGRALGIVGWFLFAAFSKEQGLLLPLLVLLWYWLSRWSAPYAHVDLVSTPGAVSGAEVLDYAATGPRATSEAHKALQFLVGALAFTMAVYVAYRNYIAPWFWERGFLNPAINPLVQSTGLDRWLIPVAIAGRYAMLLLVPYRLSLDYGMNVFTPRLNWAEPWFYMGLLAIAGWVIALLVSLRRRNVAGLFCLVAFAASYGMVSNVIMIGTIMGDRLMYVPSAFFCIWLAMILPRPTGKVGAVILVVLLLLGSVRTVSYAWEWNNRRRLYSYAVETQPKSSMGYLLLAGELKPEQSDVVLAKARQIAPDAYQVWTKSAWCKILLGQLDTAEQFAKQAFKLRSGNAESLQIMGRIQELRHPASQPATSRR